MNMEKRNQEIYERRLQGETFAAIAKDVGVSRERVKQIVVATQKQIDYRLRYPELKGDALTLESPVASVFEKRVAYALLRAHLPTLGDIAKVITETGLYPTSPGSYVFRSPAHRVHGIGQSSWPHIFSALERVGFDWKAHIKGAE